MGFLWIFFNFILNSELILNQSLFFYHIIKIKKNIIEPIGIHNSGNKFN
jgi:hypothetical protein